MKTSQNLLNLSPCSYSSGVFLFLSLCSSAFLIFSFPASCPPSTVYLPLCDSLGFSLPLPIPFLSGLSLLCACLSPTRFNTSHSLTLPFTLFPLWLPSPPPSLSSLPLFKDCKWKGNIFIGISCAYCILCSVIFIYLHMIWAFYFWLMKRNTGTIYSCMCPSDCFLQYCVGLAEKKGSPNPGLCIEVYQGNDRFSDQFLFERLKKQQQQLPGVQVEKRRERGNQFY